MHTNDGFFLHGDSNDHLRMYTPEGQEPHRQPPLRKDVERYLDEQFRDADGGFRLSLDQDFLIIRRGE